MKRVILQRDETVLQIEALRVVVLGEEVHSEDADSLRHITGCFQEVEQKQLTETLASAGHIDSKPPEVTGGYILKIDRPDPADVGFSAGGQDLKWVYPKEEELKQPERAPQSAYLKSYLNTFAAALPTTSFPAWPETLGTGKPGRSR